MNKPLILVIDDEPAVADNIAEVIRRTDRYEVKTRYSAKDGLRFLKASSIFFGIGGNKVKLVILDIKMPEMDGLQFLEKVREEYGDSIAVALLSAYEDDEKWERATSGFVIDYIKKPFKSEDLIATIDNFFEGQEGKLVLKTFKRHIERLKH